MPVKMDLISNKGVLNMLRKIASWLVPLIGILGISYLMLGHYLPTHQPSTTVQADRQSLQGFHRMQR